jgi:hypothetical protein
VSVTEAGTLHAYSTVDLSSMRRAKGWVTYVNLHAAPQAVVGLNELRINLCCPHVRKWLQRAYTSMYPAHTRAG